jgi:hypothetical protein
MEQLKLSIETSQDKAVTEFISRPFKGSLIKVYLISESEANRRRKKLIKAIENKEEDLPQDFYFIDEYCFCRCVGFTVDYNRVKPREVAIVKRLDSDFITDDVHYFLDKQKVKFLK